jgi:hypothetical protein
VIHKRRIAVTNSCPTGRDDGRAEGRIDLGLSVVLITRLLNNKDSFGERR